jgi:hypothetical protein
LLKTGIADGDGSPRTVKLEPHRVVSHQGNSPPREHQARRLPAPTSSIRSLI